MVDFINTFDPTRPVGSDFARYGQQEIRKTRSALQERLDLEHYGPGLGNQTPSAATADGRHRPGKTSVVLLDTQANILLTTPTGSMGALAFSTDTRVMFIWNGTNWTTNKVSGDSFGITPIDLTSAPVVITNPSGVSLTNAFDGDNSTRTNAIPDNDTAAGATINIDFGSIKHREMFIVYDFSRHLSVNTEYLCSVNIISGIDAISPTSIGGNHWMVHNTFVGPTSSTRSGSYTSKNSYLYRFYGRFLALNVSSGWFRLYRLEFRDL
jgi:hypothetical protein